MVSEIFRSIQGEGINAGIPAVFLRLAFCNLHCWYCDTKYTWLYNERMLETVRKAIVSTEGAEVRSDLRVYNQYEEIKQLSIEEIAREISSYPENHLVITGGEPLIQQSGIVLLLNEISAKKGFFVEIETNGTILPTRALANFVNQWNVSPKLAIAGNSKYSSEKPNVIQGFKALNSFFKFVIETDSDLKECTSLVEKYSIPNDRVLLMPEATSADLLEQRGKKLSSYCAEKGFGFSPRLHIMLYGNTRGK